MSVILSIFAALFFILVGMILFVEILFQRAKRSDHWNPTNRGNIIRLLIHIALHPEDFAKMYYVREIRCNGDSYEAYYKQCFPYIGKDELSEVVDVRPDHE